MASPFCVHPSWSRTVLSAFLIFVPAHLLLPLFKKNFRVFVFASSYWHLSVVCCASQGLTFCAVSLLISLNVCLFGNRKRWEWEGRNKSILKNNTFHFFVLKGNMFNTKHLESIVKYKEESKSSELNFGVFSSRFLSLILKNYTCNSTYHIISYIFTKYLYCKNFHIIKYFSNLWLCGNFIFWIYNLFD